MANCTKKQIPVQEKILLELSLEEAEVLKVIVESIGGSTFNSPRSYADEISKALGSIGIKYNNDIAELILHDRCSIFFNPYE